MGAANEVHLQFENPSLLKSFKTQEYVYLLSYVIFWTLFYLFCKIIHSQQFPFNVTHLGAGAATSPLDDAVS